MSSTTHAHTPAFTLTPANQSVFSPIAAQVVEICGFHSRRTSPGLNWEHYAPAENAYAMGCMEGELAYAVAAEACKDTPADVVTRCRDVITLTFGLAGKPLSIAEERQRGFLVGMLDTLGDAITMHEEACDEAQPKPETRPETWEAAHAGHMAFAAVFDTLPRVNDAALPPIPTLAGNLHHAMAQSRDINELGAVLVGAINVMSEWLGSVSSTKARKPRRTKREPQ